jgi:thymidylate synthase (FAD)
MSEGRSQYEIRRVQPESPMADVMGGDARREIRVHEYGFIALVDVMPRLVPAGADGRATGDGAIVQAARVSYGQGTKKISEDRGLIRYLLRHRHTTPFEMVEFKFHVAMPIFVARQWIRHRTASVNEYSGRYSVMPDHFYRPDPHAIRKQSSTNKQGGEEAFGNDHHTISSSDARLAGPESVSVDSTPAAFLAYLDEAEALYEKYRALTERGVSRELARIGLPVSVYTQWYWKCDLHNILRFLSLRMDKHAQAEIRDYALAMHALIEPIVPITMEAWRDYAFESVHLSRLEAEAIREIAAGGPGTLDTDNTREQREWEVKRKALGLAAQSVPATPA